jgi:hypothetical protein
MRPDQPFQLAREILQRQVRFDEIAGGSEVHGLMPVFFT